LQPRISENEFEKTEELRSNVIELLKREFIY
jgi:hypothetical protein